MVSSVIYPQLLAKFAPGVNEVDSVKRNDTDLSHVIRSKKLDGPSVMTTDFLCIE